MDPTHNFRTFFCLLEWFSEAQLLYPTIINDKEIGCLFSDSLNNKILCNYAFNISEDEIHDMNKTLYRNFRAYTEAKCAFVIAEEIKAIKMNKISETYKSK